jgi:tetratricopeptide (TPR) repeat protein
VIRSLTVAPTASTRLSNAAGLLDRRWCLPVVLLVGALLRLGHVVAIRDAIWLRHLLLDHRVYDEWGQRIAAGDWVGSQAYFVDPLYAYFLGVVYAIAGHRPLVVLVIQAGLGVGTCYLTCLLGRRVFGPRIGILAGLVMALYAPAIFGEALIEKTALGVFLFTLSLVLYLGQSRRQIILSAVVLGLAALARGTFLVFIPLGAVALLLRGPSGARIRVNGEIAGRFLMASFLVLSVAVARNSLVAGVTATTTNLGQNLYIGNHAGNVDGTYTPPSFVRPDPRFEEADFRAEAERRQDRALTPQEISSYWRGQAFAEMAEHPRLTLERTIKKVRLFWHDYEVPDNGNIYLARDDSWILRLPLLSMGLLFPLALLGVGLSFRTNSGTRALATVALVYCGSVASFFILARLRIQILPILAVLATFGATRLVATARAKSWRSLSLQGGVVLAALLFSMITPSWIEAKKAPSMAVGYNNLGVLYAGEGQLDRAIAAYEKAIMIDAPSVVGAMRAVAEIYLQRGEYDKAEIRMRRVLELKPDSRLGRDALVRLSAARAGKLPAATAAPGAIDEATAGAVVRALSAVGPGHPVWFSTFRRDGATDAFYRAVRELFERAGWVVRREDEVSFATKPGVFLFAAEEHPPAYVIAIHTALTTAGIRVAFNTGYRSYYEEMKRTRPAWNGFALTPEQTFTLVVGPPAK